MCIFAEKSGGMWHCPAGKVNPARTKSGVWCGDYAQQAVCGNTVEG